MGTFRQLMVWPLQALTREHTYYDPYVPVERLRKTDDPAAVRLDAGHPEALLPGPGWTRAIPIWPGFGFVRTGGDLVAPAGATSGQMGGKTMSAVTTQSPIYGLGALYVGGDGIDELLYAGINAFAVWVLSADAEFEILAPAFDATQTWTDPTDGSGSNLVAVSLSGSNQGMLSPLGQLRQHQRPGRAAAQGQQLHQAHHRRSHAIQRS